jgi:hypothetical protein
MSFRANGKDGNYLCKIIDIKRRARYRALSFKYSGTEI